jgi:transposase
MEKKRSTKQGLPQRSPGNSSDPAWAGCQALTAASQAVWFGFASKVTRRPDNAKGFELLVKHWIVERVLARLDWHRRLSKDPEVHPGTCRCVGLTVASAGQVSPLGKSSKIAEKRID